MFERLSIDPRIQLIVSVVVVTALLNLLLRLVLRRIVARSAASGQESRRAHWFAALATPLTLLIWYYGLYTATRLIVSISMPPSWRHVEPWIENLWGLGAFVAITWLIQRTTRVADQQMRAAAERTPSRIDDVVLPVFGLALRVLVPIFALFFLIRLYPFPPTTIDLLRKVIAIALIVAIAWILRRAVLLTEATMIKRDSLRALDNYAGRALVTRVSVLRKVSLVVITLFSIAGVLMLFEEVRDVGRSILASAGIAGIVLGFAAQRSLSGIFAGLQIALTQPIRIGDLVNIEGQVGFVEEITLTYVVVKIWDERRLILPIGKLIESPIINHTRGSTQMQAPVVLRVDFTLPIEPLRRYMESVIRASPVWDKRSFAVQVTDARHESMEVRIMGSAASSGDAFALQCELREKAIEFIHLRFPQCLPKAREEGKPIQGWQISEEFGPRDATPEQLLVRPPPAPEPAAEAEPKAG